MAFEKTITTRGAAGSYIRPVAWRMDDNAREMSVLFALFVDQEHSDRSKPGVPRETRDRPLVEIVAKLRVSGQAYEDAFGSVARKAAADGGADLVAMIYDAAKAVSIERQREGVENPEAQIVSDFGGDLFADARNV